MTPTPEQLQLNIDTYTHLANSTRNISRAMCAEELGKHALDADKVKHLADALTHTASAFGYNQKEFLCAVLIASSEQSEQICNDLQEVLNPTPRH